MKSFRYLFGLLIISFFSISGYAQGDVKFVVDAPGTAVKGGQLRLTYILEGGKGTDLIVPEEIEGFDVLFGPAISQSSSITIVNGKRSSHSSISYVYTLLAKEEGTFTLPAASVKVDGRNYKSNTASIKVLPPDKNAGQQSQQAGSQPQIVNSTSTAGKVSSDDVFVRAIFSKTQVKEQEAVVVTFRLYSAVNIRSFIDAKFPEFDGFMTEEFDFPVNREISAENYKGRNYYTIDVKKTLLFPQRSGKIIIPSGSVTLVLSVDSGQETWSFFGPSVVMADVEKTLRTSPVTVDVSKLPEGKPLGFSGGVGTFKLNSTISTQKIKANDAITLKLEISGTGNMKLIKTPELELAKDIEVFDPKVTNDFRISENGLTGKRTVEYLFIPRYPGKYTVPALEFPYYDTASKQYKTLSTPEYEIEVDKDPNAANTPAATSYISQQEVKVDNDIRYLKAGDANYKNYSNPFFGSLANILWYIVPALLFIGFIFMYRKQIKANADIARMRTRKANKVASRRLKLAKKYLQNNEKDKFYEESLRAVWGYLSDKLTIPIVDLSRENIEVELKAYGVGEELITKFISVLDTCEFARYAPSESDKAMDILYQEMVGVIGDMENTIKIK